MEDLPEGLFRNAIDLNRFSNGTSKKLINSYNRIILRAVAELKRIEAMPSAQRPKVRAARLRALLAQTKASLNTWSVKSVNELAKDLEGIAQIQSDFATQQISKALSPSAKQLLSVNSVEVTPSFAKAVVNADPLSVSTNILSRSMEEVVKGPSPSFQLTATQGSQIRMPGGTSIAKTFRGLAERNAERFATVVQDGLLTGETTQQLARRLVGNLDFGDFGPLSVKQLAQSGGELTKLANHQVMTLTRTSINQVANTASQQVYKSNSDLTSKYRYVATLDSKTSPICRELDGKEFFYGKGPEPAQHFNCRSTTVSVIDYDKIQKKHPNVKPPTTPLGKRAAAGGSVPSDTTYGKWLHGQRAKTKSGKMSKFEPGPMQIKTLGKEKAKYFNRLADKYGADEAMKKFLRDDGSEVSLATLHKRYGDPSKIVKKGKVKRRLTTTTTPVSKGKTEKSWKPTKDSKEAIKRGESLTTGRIGKADALAVSYKKAFNDYETVAEKYFTLKPPEPYAAKYDIYRRGYKKGTSFEKDFEAYKKKRETLRGKYKTMKEKVRKIEVQGGKEMEALRKEALKSTTSENQIKEALDKLPFVNQKKADRLKVRTEIKEFSKMFNGGGVTVDADTRRFMGGKITKVKLGTSRANNDAGEILVPWLDPKNSYMKKVAKQTVFHEVGHSLETVRQSILDMALDFRTSRVTSNIPTKSAKRVAKAWTLREAVLPDKFITPYVGRPYEMFGGDVATEVISVGVEHFAHPELMFRLYSIDRDHFHMILSLTRNAY